MSQHRFLYLTRRDWTDSYFACGVGILSIDVNSWNTERQYSFMLIDDNTWLTIQFNSEMIRKTCQWQINFGISGLHQAEGRLWKMGIEIERENIIMRIVQRDKLQVWVEIKATIEPRRTNRTKVMYKLGHKFYIMT